MIDMRGDSHALHLYCMNDKVISFPGDLFLPVR